MTEQANTNQHTTVTLALTLFRKAAGDGTDQRALYQATSDAIMFAVIYAPNDNVLGAATRAVMNEQDRLITAVCRHGR